VLGVFGCVWLFGAMVEQEESVNLFDFIGSMKVGDLPNSSLSEK